MAIIDIPIFEPGYQGRSSNFNSKRRINYYAEFDGKKACLVGFPGTRSYCIMPEYPVRGLHVYNGMLFVVAGSSLYKIKSFDRAPILVGSLSTSTGIITMSNNGVTPTGGGQMIIMDSVGGYIYDQITGSLSHISAAGFSGSGHAVCIDGFFVATKSGVNNQAIQSSNHLNGGDWNALDTSTKESTSDPIVTIGVCRNELWALGKYYSQVFYDSGSSIAPFQKVPSVLIEHGCAAEFSLASGDSALFFVAQNITGGFYAVRTNGYVVERLTTPAIEWKWSQYSNISDAIGSFFTWAGHAFYQVTFPSDDATWIYDISTGFWSERSTFPYTTAVYYPRHISEHHIFFDNKIIMNDAYGSGLYFYDENFYFEKDSLPIQRMLTTNVIKEPSEKTVIFDSIQFEMEVGIGIDDNTSPMGMLSWSDDGGRTFGTEVWASIGTIGNFKKRVKFNSLGSSRDRVFKFECSDPVKQVLISAHANVRGTLS